MEKLERRWATGRAITDFYLNHWPVGYYHEDSEHQILGEQGEKLLEGSQAYKLSEFGCLLPERTGMLLAPIDFSLAFNRWWKKTEQEVTLMVKVHRDREEELRKIITNEGGEIV